MNFASIFNQTNKLTKNNRSIVLGVATLLCSTVVFNFAKASNNISFGSNLGIYKDIVNDENADFFFST